jgi:formylglycine-generating enzyme required for sulfatase activity
MTQTPVGSERLQALQKEQSDRWRRGQRTWVEWYLARASWLRADPTQLAEFIYSEYCLRLELQETPTPDEYYRRFPQVTEPLRRLFESSKQSSAKPDSVSAPKTPAASTLQPQTPREPVRAASRPAERTIPAARTVPTTPAEPIPVAPPRPVEMTTSGTVGSDTDANVTQTGSRDRSDTVVSTLEESFSGQIFGRYELIQELGRGGMGVVWKARDVDLDRFVAIKLILPTHVESEVGVKRFQAEARASARLDHPGIVTVHDFGQRDGKYYLCMAFVDGRSLAERLAQGAMPPAKAAKIIREIAEAIHHAHERGVVHRDLKPPNILLTSADEPRVTDFGLARRIDVPEGITASGQVLGTPSYMSPEQAAGNTDLIGPATDIYAIGAILYYALAGRPPFQGTGNVLETVRKVAEGKFEPLKNVAPSVPATLEMICTRCLAKDPARRFKTAGELAAALAKWLRATEGGRAETTTVVSATAEVFLSFSHVDQSIAQAACDALEADGLRCWISPRDVVAGRTWDESSGKAIKEARAVVLVLSASANKSERVLREIEHAAKCNVPIVTFRIQDVPTAILTPHLRGPHRLDGLTEPFESHLSKLCELVRTIIPYAPDQMPAVAAPAPAVAPQPVRPAGEVRDDNGMKMKFIWCPPGRFMMGSSPDDKGRFPNEGPVDVRLTRGFWMGQVVITQAQWQHIMGTAPWAGQRWVREANACPATWVAWKDAWEFCARFQELEKKSRRLPEGWRYTLPTEAQWEYACRAGSDTRYHFGDDDSKLAQYAWFDANAFDIGKRYAHLVGRRKPNSWGIFDMHGNVWEWCRDVYVKDMLGGVDPEVRTGGREGVRRGGCWNLHAAYCRSACRLQVEPSAINHDLGFRIVLEQGVG